MKTLKKFIKKLVFPALVSAASDFLYSRRCYLLTYLLIYLFGCLLIVC